MTPEAMLPDYIAFTAHRTEDGMDPECVECGERKSSVDEKSGICWDCLCPVEENEE